VLIISTPWYFFTRKEAFQTDASGNAVGVAATSPPQVNIPSWVGWAIFAVILVLIGLSVWQTIVLTKGGASALYGIGSGVANWGKSKLK
jgi:hypothetical protein